MEAIKTRDLEVAPSGSLGVSAEEWQVRCDLAACFQLVDLFGMSDMSASHISAVVPGSDGQFLMSEYGTLFDQVTASSLLKVDRFGKPVGGRGTVNSGGAIIHGAVHRARPDLACVLHTHTTANNAVAMLADGLKPLSQSAMIIMGFLVYHDYEGVADNREEIERLTDGLSEDDRIILMRNHGALTVGLSVPEAFFWTYRLEAACRIQVAGLSCGQSLSLVSDAGIQRAVDQGRKLFGRGGESYRHARHEGDAAVHALPNAGPGNRGVAPGMAEWPSLLRKLELERGGSYRT